MIFGRETMVQNDMGISICKIENIEWICKEYRKKIYLQGIGENIWKNSEDRILFCKELRRKKIFWNIREERNFLQRQEKNESFGAKTEIRE